ncbi:MAG: zinc ribbon domain-containing protein [Gemmataceae bacterium]
MPIYEYACKKCEHTFEQLVRGDDVVACPECLTHEVQQLLSVPARPQAESAGLPMQCNTEGPSCGAPWCQKPKG